MRNVFLIIHNNLIYAQSIKKA